MSMKADGISEPRIRYLLYELPSVARKTLFTPGDDADGMSNFAFRPGFIDATPSRDTLIAMPGAIPEGFRELRVDELEELAASMVEEAAVVALPEDRESEDYRLAIALRDRYLEVAKVAERIARGDYIELSIPIDASKWAEHEKKLRAAARSIASDVWSKEGNAPLGPGQIAVLVGPILATANQIKQLRLQRLQRWT